MLIRYLAVIAIIIAMLPLSLSSSIAAKKAWPSCENFLSQDDAQAAYDADTSDPFKLVSKSSNGVPCDGIATFGTQPLVSCDALAGIPDAQAALQGLLDRTSAGGDPYGLDPDGNGTACDQATGKGGDAETLDAPQSATPQDAATPTDTTGQTDTGKAKKVKNGGNSSTSPDTSNSSAPPSSDTSSSDSTPSTETGNDLTVTTSSGGESLEAMLEARFAELEAQFAAFSGDDDTTSNGGQSSPVVVSTAPPATTSGTASSAPNTTSSTGTGTTTALHRGHHHKGHGKGHGKHHKGHKNGKHQKKGRHKHH